MEHIEDIYRKVCDNSWIGSLCKNFRSSVFDILYELFEKDIDAEKHCSMCESKISLQLIKLDLCNSIM